MKILILTDRVFVVENFNVDDCTAKLETIYNEISKIKGLL